MKKFFVLALVFLMVFCSSGCDSKTSPSNKTNNGRINQSEESYTDDNVSNITAQKPSAEPLPQLPNEGLGRTRFFLNGMGIASGDLVKDVIAEGFTTTTDLSKTLEAKQSTLVQFTFTTSNGDSDLLSTRVVNETESTRTIKDCRLYYIICSTDTKEITSEDGTNLTLEYIKSKYNINQNTTLGKPLNHMTLKIVGDHCIITTAYLEHLYPASVNDTTNTGNNDTAIGSAMLKEYMDVSRYTATGGTQNITPLNETLKTNSLSISVDNQTITFGKNGDDLSSLKNLGWKFNDEDLDKELANVNYTYYSTPYYYTARISDVKSRSSNADIDYVYLTNFTDSRIAARDGKLGGLRLNSKNYYGYNHHNKNYASFNFYGITSDSTINDIIEKLGHPFDISGTAELNEVILQYKFTDKDGILFDIFITVDTLRNELCNINFGA